MVLSHATSKEHRDTRSSEFKYAPSLNIYAHKIGETHLPCACDQKAEEHRGEWTKLWNHTTKNLGTPKKLHVEVGCNGGHFLLERAKQNTDEFFIGVDWKYKQIYFAAEKSEKRKIDNVFFVRAYAERLAHLFAPGEIDMMYVFFPDPWVKARKLKNRWVNATHLQDIAEILKSGGELHIKTDHPDYFEFMLEEIKKVQNQFEVIFESKDLHAGNPNAHKLTFPEVTLYESVFIKSQVPVNKVVLRKK
jgi:tRNA (guanine-N7-)-methyltransferase